MISIWMAHSHLIHWGYGSWHTSTMVHVGLELAIRLSCCFIPRDDAAGDANQPNPDYAETEVDPKTPMVDLGTPGSLDETPPPPDNQLGYESWERWVSKLKFLIWWNPFNMFST